ncbi:PLP-dependent aminotransferase family protein [Pelosinus fermentans]|nr:PLP-dependent aminotransferase family protein [Pelosinus fermentans]EIW22868.1 transcriptional regulator, GntR family with aminotransferase domain-containing protein [Pelosinus fermentans A11]
MIYINRNDNSALKEQIRQVMAQKIRSGLLLPGQQLPSVRVLANQLRVSLVTVVEAYNLLKQDGLIESCHGKGTFVTSFESTKSREEAILNHSNWQLAIEDYLPQASFWHHNYISLPPEILDLGSASMHHSLLPLSLLSTAIQKGLQEYPKSLSSYSPFSGDSQFLGIIVDYLKGQDLLLNIQQIIVTNGTQQGIDLFARTFLGPGDVVAMETPVFSGAIDAFRLTKTIIQPIPLDREGIRIDILEELSTYMKIKAIYTIPTYQNPTGIIMSLKRRRQLLEFAKQNGILILEDDPCRELNFCEKTKLPPTIKAIDTYGLVVYLKGFSKFLFPGMRLGILVADGTIYNRLLATKSITDLGSSLWLQKILVDFFKQPQLKRHLQKMSRNMEERSQMVFEKLNAKLNPLIYWQRTSGGMFLWITLPPSISADNLIPEAHSRGIHFLPGSIFYPRELGFNHLRICWTNLSDTDLPIALDILCDFLNDAVLKVNF